LERSFPSMMTGSSALPNNTPLAILPPPDPASSTCEDAPSSSAMSIDPYHPPPPTHHHPPYPSSLPRARTSSVTSTSTTSTSSAHFDPLSPPPVPLPVGLSSASLASPTSPSFGPSPPPFSQPSPSYGSGGVPASSSSSSSSSSSLPPPSSSSSSSSSTSAALGVCGGPSTGSGGATAPHIDRKPRSRWHGIVSGVGANLGAMVISDETVRGLKYCLQWLQYATTHIDLQVEILRGFLERAGRRLLGREGGGGAAAVSSSSSSSAAAAATQVSTPPLSPEGGGGGGGGSSHSTLTTTTTTTDPAGAVEGLAVGHVFDLWATLAGVRREVVETLRRVVDVLGRYAALYLPPAARRTVRNFILALPERWAALS
ncbi:hypothetical protein HDU67_003184, partial [Dinochytrium kinnereticum]